VDRVLVVDDGSEDETARLARLAGAHVIRHGKNRGKAAALRSGFAWALENGFDLVVSLDGDGQHDPDLIPLLLAPLRAGDADLVSGNRMTDPRGMPRSRRVVNRLTSWIATRIAGQPIPDSQCGFRAIDACVLRDVRLRASHFAGDGELVLMAALRSFRVLNVPVSCIYREEKSRIRPLPGTARLIVVALRGLAVRVFRRRPDR
jgi:glycosyltransferase involved in cell wall biosynthesis